MCYGKRTLIVFGGGQRSFGVTGGQTLKTLLTPYVDVGSFQFHSLVFRCVMVRPSTLLVLMEVTGQRELPGVKC